MPSIMPDQLLKVIMSLGNIPPNATVTKLGGTYTHTVKHKLIVYAEKTGFPTDLHAGEGCVFLVSTNGAICGYGLDKEVIWHTTLDELNAQVEETE
jgi:hypothetical protein